jgi:hypothetical protein
MKRTATLLSLMAAILAAPVAIAGSDIVKCVDSAGHVTLTDQPCDGGAVVVRMEADAERVERVERAGEPRVQPRRYVLPAADLRHTAWKRPAAARPATLAGDIATLKEARRALLMLDAKPVLAGLN